MVVTPPVVVAPIPVEEPYDWTGFYLGATGGLAVRQFKFPFELQGDMGPEEDFFVLGELRTSAGGFTAGATAGFNFQADKLVFGVETDWNWTNFATFVALTGSTDVFGPLIALDAELFARVNYFGTIRARVGVATGHDGRFLPYITGGAAYGKTELGIEGEITVDGIGGPFDETFAEFKDWGYTIGGGFEYAFSEVLTFKTEYLFVNLGTNSVIAEVNPQDPNDFFTVDVTTKFHTLRAGFNILF